MNISNKSQLLNLIIVLFCLFISTNEEDTVTPDKTFSSISYPTILTLLNRNLIMVASDGIHYINSDDLTEDITKKIEFENIINDSDEYEKTTMAQFSENDGGYIIIIVKNKIYFFKYEGTKIIDLDLPDSIDAKHYCIIPYKRENNYLYYIISYPLNAINIFALKYIKFDLNNPNSNIVLITKTIETTHMGSSQTPTFFIGVNCILMLSPLNNDTLVCFYSVSYPPEIQVRSFNPNNDFEELNDYFDYYTTSLTESFYYINGITNEEKKKALIFYHNGYPYEMTFDFENGLSEPNIILENGDFAKTYTFHKLFFFKFTQEFVIASRIYRGDCKIYLIIYYSNFTIKIQDYVNPDSQCSSTSSFSAFLNGNSYSVAVNNDHVSKIAFTKATELGIVENVQGPINEYNIYYNDNTDNNNNIKIIDNNKCKTSSSESISYNLCTLCNTEKGYYPVQVNDNSLFHGFFECFNDNTKPKNFYFNSTINKYKICYETCLTCNEEGDEYNNNCLTCDLNYIKRPDYPNSKNCVTKCAYSYYYTDYGQYKCTDNSYCPEEVNLYIKELKKCTKDCSKEDKYIYQYEGICLEKCPNNTKLNTNNICIEDNIEICSKSENEIELQEFLTSGGIDAKAKNYAKEFGYTEKHVSYFYNSQYSILLYQELNCLDELSISLAKIDFGTCNTKIQESISPINKKIIIGLIERLNGIEKSTISYFFYHPITGEKLDVNNICKNEEIIVKESVMSQLNSSDIDLNSVLFLTDQNINIFDLSDEFFTDICYHFESPNGKDIPLKERTHIYYPNITLCNSGCTCKGVNLTTMESICECTFNSILNIGLIEDNSLLEIDFGEITDILSNSNLDVLKCFQDVFKLKYIKKNFGGFIIITIFIIQLISSIIFLLCNMDQIMKYLYNISEVYISLINKNKEIIMKEPPKKKYKARSKKNNIMTIKNEEKNIKGTSSLKSEALLKNTKFFSNPLEIFNNNNHTPNIIKNNLIILNTEKNENNMDEYFKKDLNELEYDDAIKLDKRNFFNFFCDRIKKKQMIVDTFCNKSNIIPISIKIILLLLNINLYFVINGLFYSEEYIFKLYHLEEEDTFFSFFPRSINRFFYATLVSTIVGIILDCIFIEENKVKRILIRNKDDLLQLRYEISLIVKSIKTRYIIFINICFFISIISWYYVSCFNNVYKSVKIEWIKSSITLILIMQNISILLALLEALLREISFKFKSEKIYKLRQFLS